MKWKQKEENFRKWNTDRHRYLPDVCTHTLYVHNVLSQNESCTDSHFSRLSVCLSVCLSFCPSFLLFFCPFVSVLIFLSFYLLVFSVNLPFIMSTRLSFNLSLLLSSSLYSSFFCFCVCLVLFSFRRVCVHSNCISHLPWKKFKSKCGKNINESRWHFNHYRSFSVNVISSNFGSLFKYLNVSVYTSWRRGER